jgi:hypothetical protein
MTEGWAELSYKDSIIDQPPPYPCGVGFGVPLTYGKEAASSRTLCFELSSSVQNYQTFTYPVHKMAQSENDSQYRPHVEDEVDVETLDDMTGNQNTPLPESRSNEFSTEATSGPLTLPDTDSTAAEQSAQDGTAPQGSQSAHQRSVGRRPMV